MEKKSFPNYNLLKVLSKHRLHTSKKLHVGLSASNDKFRFNLYFRMPANKMERVYSIARSNIIDLKVIPGTNKITNLSGYKDIIETINILNNIDPVELDLLYENYVYELMLVHRVVEDKQYNRTDVDYKLKEFEARKKEPSNEDKKKNDKIDELERQLRSLNLEITH